MQGRRMADIDVAVIGAAGNTGRSLIRALARRGARVRALVHRESHRELFANIDEIEVVELREPQRLAQALRGVRVAHYIPPVFNTGEEEFATNVITAVSNSDASRVVYHSVLHAPTPAMPHHARKARVELALRESDLEWTIIQPAMYVQTQLMFFNRATKEINPAFNPARLFNPIDLEDLSDAVASVLLQDSHAFATYELAGPDRLSFEDMAAAISRLLGIPVVASCVDPQKLAEQRAAARGWGANAASEMRAMFEHYDAHGLTGNANVLRMLLQREPNGFEVTAKRELEAIQ
jgi:NAD(P)H dehydrogenase (quinone)